MKTFPKKLVSSGIFIFLLTFLVSAQSFLLENSATEKTRIEFQYLRPFFAGSSDLSLLSGVYDLSLSTPVNSKLNFVGSLPFVTVAITGEKSESSIGNFYIGLQHRLKSTVEKEMTVSFGAFLPTAPDDKFSALTIGAYTNYFDLQKYLPNVLTINGNLAYHRRKSSGLMYGLELGPYLMIPTKNEDMDMEIFLHYGLSLGYQIKNFILKAECAGIAIVTEDIEDFGDRFSHTITFGVLWDRGSIRPGIFYTLYLDKQWSDLIDGVLGIKIEVVLK